TPSSPKPRASTRRWKQRTTPTSTLRSSTPISTASPFRRLPMPSLPAARRSSLRRAMATWLSPIATGRRVRSRSRWMGLSKCCRARWIEVLSSSFRAGAWLFMIKLAIPRQRGGHVLRPIRGPLSARQQFVDNTMRASLHTTALTARPLIAASAHATAAEVRVLTVGSTQLAAKAIATDFEKQTRNQVTFTIRPPFDIDKELAAKTFDAIILSVPAMDNHDEAGDLAPMSRVALARVGVGVVVKEGGPVPDVSTPEKLKAAVLTARSLTYTDPATPNTSGAIAGAALAKLGILDEVKGKTRHAALAVGGELVAKGEVELGFFNLSEIPKGVTVAGALPAP